MGSKDGPQPGSGGPSIAKTVREYIDGHPSIKDCLADGLINLSALSRRICEATDIDKPEAVLVACRRYKERTPRHSEREIKRILARSRVEIASKVALVTLRNDWHIYAKLQNFLRKALSEGHTLKLIQGSRAITVITDVRTVRTIVDEIGQDQSLAVQEDLVEISVTSPESIRDTPGIMAFLYGSLSANGINVLETMSTYTDTIFIVDPSDMMRAFEILSNCINEDVDVKRRREKATAARLP